MNTISKYRQNPHSARILIVDDQRVNCMVLERTLLDAGYQNIKVLNDSTLATDHFIAGNYDLMLLDVHMPVVDGFDVMEELKQRHDDELFSVIMLTAESDENVKSKALSLGAKDFLTKPFNKTEVVHRINNTIATQLLNKRIINDNQELELRVKERTEALEKSYHGLVESLSIAAQYKDNETGSHVSRMSYASYLLALEYGFTQDKAELLLHAAPMHDIGKIGIPDKILLKPSKLNAQEWVIMKSHVNIGAEILSGKSSPLIEMARTVALTHHEKWDGSGYPQGLSGENIPIEGRICALCDVMDALTSKRPYKRAWTFKEAVDYMDDQQGLHFDPELVTLYKQILPEVMMFNNNHSDHEPDNLEEDKAPKTKLSLAIA